MYLDDNGGVVVEYVFGRSFTNFATTVVLPTTTANILGYSSNFFGKVNFDVAIGVNLTIMLVIITM
jgi:hypothetical protein